MEFSTTLHILSYKRKTIEANKIIQKGKMLHAQVMVQGKEL